MEFIMTATVVGKYFFAKIVDNCTIQVHLKRGTVAQPFGLVRANAKR